MSLTRLLAALPEPLYSDYSLDEVLGVGAYAVVYQIRHRNSGEAYALKVIEKHPLEIRAMLPQLKREVSLLEMHARTDNIVQLLEVVNTDSHVFMRFHLCQQNLEQLSEDVGSMKEQEALLWLREACRGVQGLHDTGVIHRDLKPSNFLIDQDGTLRICDFGWACYEDQELTGICGTPEYSAPETLKEGLVHTSKVDTYGLGKTFQHLLLGGVPKGPKDFPKGASKSVRKLIAEMTDQDPEARPSIDELLMRPELDCDSLLEFIKNQWDAMIDAIAEYPAAVGSSKQKKIKADADAMCGIGLF